MPLKITPSRSKASGWNKTTLVNDEKMDTAPLLTAGAGGIAQAKPWLAFIDNPMTPQFFHTPSDLRAWLEANHESSQELWLRLRKTTVPGPGVTYSEALDLALCFGWIDGVRHAVDGKSFAVRFTPRKPESTWSKVNIRLLRRPASRNEESKSRCWPRGASIMAAVLLALSASASPHNPDTDWFHDAGWGVFVHYLWDVQNVGGRENTQGKPPTTWDALVREFDTDRFAEQVRETGAPYVFFTMMQRTRYLIAPNATYDRLTGYKPGEACSTRDLVADLYRSLEKRGIKLMLYWTGDGPREDAQAAQDLGGWTGQVSDQYVQNWAAVAAEYSRRYGDKVKGWWVDGCYAHIGYNETRWRVLSQGVKAGNPHAIIALNNPAMAYANSSTDYDDFTTGEVNAFTDIPEDRWRDGKQFHVLSYLGRDWGRPGCRYDLAFLADYVSQVNEAGGVVTIDIALFRDGSLDPSQVKLLSRLRPAIQELTAKHKIRSPISPGNLAYRKPAKLLSLDGTRTLPPNGGAGRLHLARCGVDGDPATDAQASAEWPWTYEVDLTEPAAIRRIVITFGKNFATRFQVQLSLDHSAWTTVAEVKDHDGAKWEKTIAAVSARYVRIRALKPDGDHQKGGQMSVAELEVYTADGAERGK
jgi:hypothetical protein